ncbi:MAG: hypothetical protein K0R60_784 [Microbacterium sp.]|jgi:hypothetical protein|nr:hypothetical protein [Microbacterium sp.]MDF2554889.1 hypothetical protein [Microbacterium sp.]
MRHDLLSTIAGGLLILEGAAIAVLAVVQAGAIIGGDTSFLESAIALLVLTVIGAAAVVAFGVATIRGRSWGRSGGIVTQLLVLAVAFGAATGVFAHPLLGLQLAIPAVVALVLLFAAVRRAGRDPESF